MMYADVDVRMGRGGQPDADKSGQGGGVKITKFLRTSFMDDPLVVLFMQC